MANEIETLEQAVAELKRRRREDPLSNVYKPNKYQIQIHRSRAPITCAVGGNRTGKSYCGVAEALLYCLGRSTYAEVPEPPNRVWYIVPTSAVWTETGGIKEEVFEELVPWSRVVEHNKRRRTFKFDNGSTLTVKTADQRQKRVVGASIDLVVADEPMPRSFFEELQARVIDKNGRILMIFTPVGEKISQWAWIRDQLYTPAQVGERKDVELVNLPMIDENGDPAVPHLTKAQVEQFARSYPDPEVRAARMLGEFVNRAGLVFSGLDEDINITPAFDVPHHWHEWLVCDPQYHRFAVLMFAADDQGNYYVTDEYFSSDEPMAIRSERIKAMVGPRDRPIPMYVDYANPQDVQELNYHFNRLGADIGAVELPITKRVEKMILRVHSMLEPDPDRPYHPETGLGDVFGAPRLLFFDNLRSVWKDGGRKITGSRLLWELKRLTWGKRNKPDKDTAGGADATDCLIYGCSITAIGRPPEDNDSWRHGLNARDQTLWEAIEHQDRRQEQGLQNPT